MTVQSIQQNRVPPPPTGDTGQQTPIGSKTFCMQISDAANSAWTFSAQKTADLKDGVLSVISKVIACLTSIIQTVTGWCGYISSPVLAQGHAPQLSTASEAGPVQERLDSHIFVEPPEVQRGEEDQAVNGAPSRPTTPPPNEETPTTTRRWFGWLW